MRSNPSISKNIRLPTLRDEMAAVEAFTKLALSAREAQKLKIRQPLAKMILGPADDIGLKAANRFQDILKDDLNVKVVEILAPGTPSPLDYEIKLNFRAAGPKFGKQIKEVSAALTANHDLVISKARAGEAVELTISTGTVSVAPDELIMQALPNPDLAIAEEAGFGNVRTMQRRIQEAIGMTPAEYRQILTRDL